MKINSAGFLKSLLALACVVVAFTQDAIAQGQGGGGAAASGTPSTAGVDVEDTLLGTRAKAALLADPDIDDNDIAVDVHQGDIVLSGNVGSREQLVRAIEVVRGIDGVLSVQNRLVIGN